MLPVLDEIDLIFQCLYKFQKPGWPWELGYLKLSEVTKKEIKEEFSAEINSYPDLFREFALWIDASGNQAKSVNISSKSKLWNKIQYMELLER